MTFKLCNALTVKLKSKDISIKLDAANPYFTSVILRLQFWTKFYIKMTCFFLQHNLMLPYCCIWNTNRKQKFRQI